MPNGPSFRWTRDNAVDEAAYEQQHRVDRPNAELGLTGASVEPKLVAVSAVNPAQKHRQRISSQWQEKAIYRRLTSRLSGQP